MCSKHRNISMPQTPVLIFLSILLPLVSPSLVKGSITPKISQAKNLRAFLAFFLLYLLSNPFSAFPLPML